MRLLSSSPSPNIISQDVFDALGLEHIRPEFRNLGGEYKKILGETSEDSEEEFSEGESFWWEESDEEDEK